MESQLQNWKNRNFKKVLLYSTAHKTLNVTAPSAIDFKY